MQAERFGKWASCNQAHHSKKFKAGTCDAQFVQGLKWTDFVNGLKRGQEGAHASTFNSMDVDPEMGTLQSWHPLTLAIEVGSASVADNPTWEQAMNGPDREGHLKAA